MEGQQQAPNVVPQHVDDTTLMREGRQALEQRLGVLGSLRFLRLVSGQNDRFEDIRRKWEDMSEEELFAVDDVKANP
jgi:hypothetical protein